MHLQRMVLPDGRVTWTAFENDEVVREIRDFVVHLEALHYAPKTVATYARYAVRLGSYLAGFNKRFHEITPADFERFVPALLKGKTLASGLGSSNLITLPQQRTEVPRSLHNHAIYATKALYQFLNSYAGSWLFQERSAAPIVTPDRYKPFLAHIAARRPQRRYERRSHPGSSASAAKRAAEYRLTPAQVLRIIESATTIRDAFLVILLYSTGMRISEARGLLHEDVKIDDQILWVTPRLLENGARVKGQRSRPVPIPEFLINIYIDYICSDEYAPAFNEGTEFVFCNIKGGRLGRGLSESNTHAIQCRLQKRSGVRFTWHLFRHTHASETISQGYSLLEVADRLGHASPQTTNSIYKHLFNSELRKMRSRGHSEMQEKFDELRREGFFEERLKWV